MWRVLRRVVVQVRLRRVQGRRSKMVWMALLVCLLLFGMGIVGACDSTTPVDVTVTDDEDNPVEGEEVTLVDPRTGDTVGEATTDSDGEISLPADNGRIEIVVGDKSKTVTVPAQTNVDIAVDPAGLEKSQSFTVPPYRKSFHPY